MTQVSGRAGRDQERGKVIIQTGDIDHWVIQKVNQHNYVDFYNSEIIERKNFFYPPFYKIINLTLKHRDENMVNKGANSLTSALRAVFKERVLGPEFPPIRRIQNQFMKEIKLKIEKNAPDTPIKDKIRELLDQFYSQPEHKSIRVVIDVDPA